MSTIIYKKKNRGDEKLNIVELRAKARVNSQVHGLVGWKRLTAGEQEVRFDRYTGEFISPELFAQEQKARAAQNCRKYSLPNRHPALEYLRYMNSW